MGKGKHETFVKEILSRSHSKDYDEAILEWSIISTIESQTPETCICGHFPITQIAVVKNKETGASVEVGSTCVSQFTAEDPLPMELVLKAVTAGHLDYWDAEFYSNTKDKSRLSAKQKKHRDRINRVVRSRAFGK